MDAHTKRMDGAIMGLLGRIRFWNRARRFRRRNEQPECDFALACLRPGQSVLDVGAHKAAFTYWLWRGVGRQGTVYAFEPQRSLNKLVQRFADACPPGNVHAARIALSDGAGEGELKIPLNDLSCGSLLGKDRDGEVVTEVVPLCSLDHYLGKVDARRPISFIKCDVEGHEAAVLRGAVDVLNRDRPVVMIESFRLENPAFDVLRELGFAGYGFRGETLTRLADLAPKDRSLRHNFIFLDEARLKIVNPKPPYAVEWSSGREGRAA